MKKVASLIFLVVFLVVGAGAVVYLAQPVSPCDTPKGYQLGQVDPRFNLTRAEAIKDTKEAVVIWSQIYGKPLFTEVDPSRGSGQPSLRVDFVFDERQALTNQINSLENRVGVDRAGLDARTTAFNARVADFQAKMTDLNGQIDAWNKKGGAPPDVYQDLTSRQRALRDEAAKLQQEANSLNLSARDFNLQVGQLNNTINAYNGVLAQKPEEGVYKSEAGNETIAVYFANSRPKLVHTLAHELGHALGMGHVDDKNSIMYLFTSEIITPSIEDISDLTRVCQKVPRFRLIQGFQITSFLPESLFSSRE